MRAALMMAVLLFGLAAAPQSVITPYDGRNGPQPDVSLEIAAGINAYRRGLGLPPVPVSPSLTQVARAHARDLAANRPDTGVDERGQRCNSHSWSAQGDWTPVCYTSDHRYAQGMWFKPREVTRGAYPYTGYENAFTSSGLFTAQRVVDSWASSPGHEGVIAERGTWAGKNWQAMGVGVANGYAVVWFGAEPDPVR